MRLSDNLLIRFLVKIGEKWLWHLFDLENNCSRICHNIDWFKINFAQFTFSMKKSHLKLTVIIQYFLQSK